MDGSACFFDRFFEFPARSGRSEGFDAVGARAFDRERRRAVKPSSRLRRSSLRLRSRSSWLLRSLFHLAMSVTPAPLAIAVRNSSVGVARVLLALVAVEELDEVPATALFAGGDRRGAGRHRLLADDREVAEVDLRFAAAAPWFRSPAAGFLRRTLCRPGTAGRRTRSASPWPRVAEHHAVLRDPVEQLVDRPTSSRLRVAAAAARSQLTTIRTSDDDDRQEDARRWRSAAAACGAPAASPSLSACSRSSRRCLALAFACRSSPVSRRSRACAVALTEEHRHQHRAGHAPLADRFDLEQLQVGQVDAVAEADQRDAEAAEAGQRRRARSAQPAAAT